MKPLQRGSVHGLFLLLTKRYDPGEVVGGIRTGNLGNPADGNSHHGEELR